MDDASFELLKAFFKGVKISKANESKFRSLWKVFEFEQSEIITEAGNIERYFYFVLSGVQAIYVLNKKGDKVVLGFSYAGSPSGVFDSFVEKRPSDSFLEALKPTRMVGINLTDYTDLFERFPEFNKWGHDFFRAVLIGRLSREIELLTLSAKDRYVTFMQRCPEVLKVIPQKYLSSYLNMSPETYSRLRGKVTY